MSRITRFRALWPFFLRLALKLVRCLRQVCDERLELLLEVLLGDLLRLALHATALRHLAVEAAGGDERGEKILAQLRIGHRALDVWLQRVGRERRSLRLRHVLYHLSFESGSAVCRLRSPRVRALLSLALHPKRLLALIGGLIGAVVYVWIAAVRAVPAVRERKTAKRRAWQARVRKRP